jgi:peptide deformylase
MIKSIVIYGHPKLRETSIEISQFGYRGLYFLINDMFETMENAGGAGLAAPQIGLNIKLIIVKINDFKKAFINPLITWKSEKLVSEIEGCLSIPNLSGPVERPDEIRVTYLDEKLKQHTDEFKGLEARIIQHEIDHLDGVLWIDHLGENRKLIEEPLEYIKNMNVHVNYPIL